MSKYSKFGPPIQTVVAEAHHFTAAGGKQKKSKAGIAGYPTGVLEVAGCSHDPGNSVVLEPTLKVIVAWQGLLTLLIIQRAS